MDLVGLGVLLQRLQAIESDEHFEIVESVVVVVRHIEVDIVVGILAVAADEDILLVVVHMHVVAD